MRGWALPRPAFSSYLTIFKENIMKKVKFLAISAAILALCVVFAALRGHVFGVIGGAIYGASMIILYTLLFCSL